eukprot:NODE_2680_length_2167_cov_2.222549.p1 GENE.NODE_2680_length_2167_cov_2.222549~~NODE_2680_length_2167_cov_2.222549.p1  ORF type:complete len:428 (+),score=110.17 NODE_2680_length_2167_cov_2.222549:629-1912(+)
MLADVRRRASLTEVLHMWRDVLQRCRAVTKAAKVAVHGRRKAAVLLVFRAWTVVVTLEREHQGLLSGMLKAQVEARRIRGWRTAMQVADASDLRVLAVLVSAWARETKAQCARQLQAKHSVFEARAASSRGGFMALIKGQSEALRRVQEVGLLVTVFKAFSATVLKSQHRREMEQLLNKVSLMHSAVAENLKLDMRTAIRQVGNGRASDSLVRAEIRAQGRGELNEEPASPCNGSRDLSARLRWRLLESAVLTSRGDLQVIAFDAWYREWLASRRARDNAATRMEVLKARESRKGILVAAIRQQVKYWQHGALTGWRRTVLEARILRLTGATLPPRPKTSPMDGGDAGSLPNGEAGEEPAPPRRRSIQTPKDEGAGVSSYALGQGPTRRSLSHAAETHTMKRSGVGVGSATTSRTPRRPTSTPRSVQ